MDYLFGGTVLPNNTDAGGTVLHINMHVCGTVLPNNTNNTLEFVIWQIPSKPIAPQNTVKHNIAGGILNAL